MYLLNGENDKFVLQAINAFLREKSMQFENLGIPDNGYFYHLIDDMQERSIEFSKTENFLNWLINEYPKEFGNHAGIKFINYGDTELVYVVDDSGYKRTLLVGQPNVKFGTVKIEYENLQKLYKQNPSLVVCPTIYFSHVGREAYLTPYFHQARCIATQETGWGAYIPEPNYHFETYSGEDEYTICTTIIANLLTLYNEQEKLGLASCKIGGGDFILEKEWDKEPHTIENTLKRMHLIAARKLLPIELSTYINLLRNEFSQSTYYKNLSERNPSILVNHKNRCPMMKESIEDGITLGLKLRKCSG